MGFTKTPQSDAEAAARRWAEEAPPLGADGTTGPDETGLVTVHVKLSREEHAAMRRIADEELSSMQRLFRLYARQRIADARRAG